MSTHVDNLQIDSSHLMLSAVGCEVEVVVQGEKIRALLDTGASSTCIDRDLAAALDLPVVGKAGIGGALSHQDVNVYRARIDIPGVDFSGTVDMPAIARPGRDRMLLGRDILRGLVFTWNGPAGTVTVQHTADDSSES